VAAAQAWGLVDDDDEDDDDEEDEEDEEDQDVHVSEEDPALAAPTLRPAAACPSRSRRCAGDDGSEERVPTELNTLNYGNFLKVSTDKRSIRYVGDGAHGNDVGAIQSNHPVPSQCLIYYFEVEIKDGGQRQCVGVGFSDPGFKLSRQPGWETNSFGYHGDDGRKYQASGRGQHFAAPFGTGDVVGAGVHLAKRTIFYTKNGKMLGTAFEEAKLPLYPTIGLHSKNEHVTVNFGDRPFIFDIEAMIAEERQKMQEAVSEARVPAGLAHSLVRQYLEHYGCQGTLRALDESSGGGEDQAMLEGAEAGAGSLELRCSVRRMLLAGDVDGAMTKIQTCFPTMWQDNPTVAFHLHSQKFLELVAQHAVVDAVHYAQTHLAPFRGLDPQFETVLQDVTAVLAYEDLDSSPVWHLMGLGQRELVADMVNAAVLRHSGLPDTAAQSSLELLLRQVTVCHSELREVNGSQGEIFNVQNAIALG